jgi:hypothetical protein
MRPTIEEQLHIYFSEIYASQPTHRVDTDQRPAGVPPVELIEVNDERSTMNHPSPFRSKRIWATGLAAASILVIAWLAVSLTGNQVTDTSVDPVTGSTLPPTPTTQFVATSEATTTETSVPEETSAGFGVIEFNGIVYEAEFRQCESTANSFEAEGIYDGEEGRWTMNFFFKRDKDYNDDGQLDQNAGVGLGRNIPDPEFALPWWESTILEGIDSPFHEFTFEQTETMVFGSGQMFDNNGIVIPKDESFPFTFSATCTGEQG